MKKNNSISRRRFIAGTLIISILDISRPLLAQTLPKVAETDPTAAALGYKHNVADIDSMMFPGRETAADGDTHFCNTCILYTEESAGSDWGACALFPGKSVAAEGWCNVWSAKPA